MQLAASTVSSDRYGSCVFGDCNIYALFIQCPQDVSFLFFVFLIPLDLFRIWSSVVWNTNTMLSSWDDSGALSLHLSITSPILSLFQIHCSSTRKLANNDESTLFRIRLSKTGNLLPVIWGTEIKVTIDPCHCFLTVFHLFPYPKWSFDTNRLIHSFKFKF